MQAKRGDAMYENLRYLRKQNNISGEEIAKSLGLTKATYSKKENGLVKFSLDEAKVISTVFNKSIEEIFFKREVSKMDTKYR